MSEFERLLADESASFDAIFEAVPEAEISDGVRHTVTTKIDVLVRLLRRVIAERDEYKTQHDSALSSWADSWERLNRARNERDDARAALSDANLANLTFNIKAAKEINAARAEAGTLHFEQAWNLVQDERDAARAALTEACDRLEGLDEVYGEPRKPIDVAALRTRGGVMSPFIEGKNDR